MRANLYDVKVQHLVLKNKVIDKEVKQPVEKNVERAAHPVSIQLRGHETTKQRVRKVNAPLNPETCNC
jgi:hypothetical protein